MGHFGISVALSGDTALVGAYWDNVGAYGNAGSAYVFTRSGTFWRQQAKLIAQDAATGDLFGSSVALSGDRALVGAVLDDTMAGADAGSAYVFVRSGILWKQQAKLGAGDAAVDDHFGVSVALSGDTALVGAYWDDTTAGADAGSAYAFTYNGSLWTQQAKLSAGDAAAGDSFGVSVALSGDTALVGACLDDTTTGNNTGSTYIFTRGGTLWKQQTKLSVGDAGDCFGNAVALSGNRVLVGAYGDGSPHPVTGDPRSSVGSVFVFQLNVPLPEIALYGNGVDIANGDPTPSLADHTDFGSTSMVNGSIIRTFKIINSGSGALFLTDTPRVKLSGSSAFTVTQQPMATVSANAGKQTVQISFKPASRGAHVATARITSNDADESPFEFTISGTGVTPPRFTTQPVSRLLLTGSEATFSAMADGDPVISYQWKRGTVNIAGAISDFFTVPMTKATDAAAYTVVAQNGVVNPVSSDPAYLGLVTLNQGTQVLKIGGTLRLTCTVAAPKVAGVTVKYDWFRQGSVNPISNGSKGNGAVVTGATTGALSIAKIGTADADTYTCRVTLDTPGNDPTLTNGDTVVRVVDAVPVVAALPPESVSVSEPIDITIIATNSPTSFSATGLPAGLKFDTKTGRLTGKPTTPSKKTLGVTSPSIIKFKATNPFGTSEEESFLLTIEPLVPGVVGTFSGLVARSGHSNFGMGGHVKITVAATGVVSGDVTLAGQKHSLVGSLDVSLGNLPTFDLVVKRTPASLGDLRLGGNISPPDDLLSGI